MSTTAKSRKNPKNKVKLYHSLPDRILTASVWVLLIIIMIVILVPLMFILASSFSDPSAVSSGKVFLWPVDFSLVGYKAIFQSPQYPARFYQFRGIYAGGNDYQRYADSVRRLSSVQGGFENPRADYVSVHSDHVFQRRHDTYLSGGEQAAPDRYVLGYGYSFGHGSMERYPHQDLYPEFHSSGNLRKCIH